MFCAFQTLSLETQKTVRGYSRWCGPVVSTLPEKRKFDAAEKRHDWKLMFARNQRGFAWYWFFVSVTLFI